ncbi:unnamed protein product [Rotaria sp. Silwood1]|nr:unnamed protein product [Rotaria sp. Silwood1]CAF1287025.1 unnamed protein product [Rotaria sp. Silwood1]CAF1291496.1 unnamed protein product [Rotaria sp. Silwood1]CAF3507893.1 unnamed protein product [Rotaria sp. Silwood1]CAF3515147.1 unnamed protein product [Rotaria sp. Silwood1]
MKNSHQKSIEPLLMLPRFDSQAILNETHLKQIPQSNSIYPYNSLSSENIIYYDTINKKRIDENFLISQTVSQPQLTCLLLPRFNSHHQQNFYDENQSADITTKTMSQTKINDEEFQQTNDHNAYTVIGDSLESYIHYRKLNHCKALSNFLEYRNKIYKREKIAQYASLKTKDTYRTQTTNAPTKVIRLEESQTSPSIISENASSSVIPSSQSLVSKRSKNLSSPGSKEEFIQIPSSDLLKTLPSKSVQPITSPKQQRNVNVPKKNSSIIKQTPTQFVKG